MNAATALYWATLNPSQSRTNSGPLTKGEHTLEIKDAVKRFFIGPSTATNLTIVAENKYSTPTIATQIDEIKELLDITTEELAKILGTTRQTIHNWKKGSKISARREQRLERTLQAVRVIHQSHGDHTRRLFLASEKGQVRIFDLFAEGSIEAAIALALRKPQKATQIPEEYSLAVQSNLIEDFNPPTAPKINKKFSGTL